MRGTSTAASEKQQQSTRHTKKKLSTLSWRTAGMVVAGLAFIIVMWWQGQQVAHYTTALTQYADSLPRDESVLIHVVAGIFLTLFLVPSIPVNFSAGALLGVMLGTAATVIGCTIGACLCFLFTRHFARSWAEKKLESSPRLRALDREVRRSGFNIVLIARLSPVFPFPHFSYAFGATSVGFWQYTLATAVGMTPGTAVFCLLASEVRAVNTEGIPWYRSPALWVTVIGTVLSVFLLIRFIKRLMPELAAVGDKDRSEVNTPAHADSVAMLLGNSAVNHPDSAVPLPRTSSPVPPCNIASTTIIISAQPGTGKQHHQLQSSSSCSNSNENITNLLQQQQQQVLAPSSGFSSAHSSLDSRLSGSGSGGHGVLHRQYTAKPFHNHQHQHHINQQTQHVQQQQPHYPPSVYVQTVNMIRASL